VKDYQRRSPNQLRLKSDPDSDVNSKADINSISNTPTQQKIKQEETNHLHHQRQVKQEHQIISNNAESAVLNTKPPAVVIDLLSSDSEDDGESSEEDPVLILTRILQDEAIGRGANRKEMEVYARHLFRLGLHSKEMILDALDCNPNCLDDGNRAVSTDTNMTSGIVNRWEWMKPFHRTVFHRWVRTEQQRLRKGGNCA